MGFISAVIGWSIFILVHLILGILTSGVSVGFYVVYKVFVAAFKDDKAGQVKVTMNKYSINDLLNGRF